MDPALFCRLTDDRHWSADRFREAGKLGLRERRLGSLLTLALVKAGQRLLYDNEARGP